MNDELTKALENLLKDGLRFISKLMIKNKKGAIVKLTPTEEQLQMFHALETDSDCLFLKPRQIGSSTFIAAYLFWKWYTSEGPEATYILSHKLDSAKHIFKIFKTFYENMPKALQKPLSVCNTTEMTLDGTGAQVIAVSAGSEGGLRSFSCRRLMISEFAFAPNPGELKATALSALNGNQLIIESTANFFGDALHEEILTHLRGETDWEYRFFPWTSHAEYRLEPPSDWEPKHAVYNEANRLTDVQAYWREKAIYKFGMDKFTREYPINISEAFQQGADAYFSDEDLQSIQTYKAPRCSARPYYLSEPLKGHKYAIGVDTAGGTGRDYSTICVMDKHSYDVVAMYRSNTVIPRDFGDIIAEVSVKYNKALTIIESNNHGHAVIQRVEDLGGVSLWRQNGKYWNTTAKSKTALFDQLRVTLRDGYIKTLDDVVMAELRSFEAGSGGKAPSVPDNAKHHGDAVIALALTVRALDDVKLENFYFLPEFVKRQMYEEKVKKGRGLHDRLY